MAHGGHEVAVAVPAGNHVAVDVGVDAGAGGASQVDADVEAVGAQGALDAGQGAGGEVVEFQDFALREGFQRGGVAVGDHHQVSRAVGVGVEDHETAFAAVDDEMGLVVGIFGEIAENASVVAAAAVNVGVSPGCHQSFHVNFLFSRENFDLFTSGAEKVVHRCG